MPMPTLSDEQVQAVIANVEKVGRERGKAQGKAFSDVDFACGAMAVFEAIGIWASVPAKWVFNPMRNMSIFKEENGKS